MPDIKDIFFEEGEIISDEDMINFVKLMVDKIIASIGKDILLNSDLREVQDCVDMLLE